MEECRNLKAEDGLKVLFIAEFLQLPLLKEVAINSIIVPNLTPQNAISILKETIEIHIRLEKEDQMILQLVEMIIQFVSSNLLEIGIQPIKDFISFLDERNCKKICFLPKIVESSCEFVLQNNSVDNNLKIYIELLMKERNLQNVGEVLKNEAHLTKSLTQEKVLDDGEFFKWEVGNVTSFHGKEKASKKFILFGKIWVLKAAECKKKDTVQIYLELQNKEETYRSNTKQNLSHISSNLKNQSLVGDNSYYDKEQNCISFQERRKQSYSFLNEVSTSSRKSSTEKSNFSSSVLYGPNKYLKRKERQRKSSEDKKDFPPTPINGSYSQERINRRSLLNKSIPASKSHNERINNTNTTNTSSHNNSQILILQQDYKNTKNYNNYNIHNNINININKYNNHNNNSSINQSNENNGMNKMSEGKCEPFLLLCFYCCVHAFKGDNYDLERFSIDFNHKNKVLIREINVHTLARVGGRKCPLSLDVLLHFSKNETLLFNYIYHHFLILNTTDFHSLTLSQFNFILLAVKDDPTYNSFALYDLIFTSIIFFKFS